MPPSVDQSFNQLEKFYKQLLHQSGNFNDSGNLSEVAIEEKLRKKLANEFKMLEQEASAGIKQRDEAIKKRDEIIRKLKKEKEKMNNQLKNSESNQNGMEAA